MGDGQQIEWNSMNLAGDIRIELSRNGGVTYAETLFAGIPDTGSVVWTVTGPPTAKGRFRVVSVASPAILDASDGDVGIFQSSVVVAPEWNLLSVPVTVSDLRMSELFPSAETPAYSYTPGGYQSMDTLEYGKGYWVKFPDNGEIILDGTDRPTDTVAVTAGWRLLGSISYPVVVDSIVQVPPGIVTNVYKYIPLVGYQTSPPVIMPGEAVWVKVLEDGQLILRKGVSARPGGETMTTGVREWSGRE
jgi:hypothetical protein